MDYDLVIASVKTDIKRPGYEEVISSFQKEISQLEIVSYCRVDRKLCYLLLFKKNMVPEFESNKHWNFSVKRFECKIKVEKYMIYKNHILQLFFNQLSGNTNLNPSPNKTSELLITRPEWTKSGENIIKQKFALKIQLDWEGALTTNVDTFTEESKKTTKTDLYVVNENRGIMQSAFYDRSDTIYSRRNPFKENGIDYVLLEDVGAFNRSKVGVIDQIVASINKYFSVYFEPNHTLKFTEFPVTNENTDKLPSERIKGLGEKKTWNYFFGANVNVYCSGKDKISVALFQEIKSAFLRSQIFKKFGMNFTFSDHSMDGLNFQVLRDTRKQNSNKEEIIEEYEVGNESIYIQHITPDGFGGLDKKNKINYHANEKKDCATDPKVINIFDNLAIKEQLINKKIVNVGSDLIETTSRYVFFSLDWFEDSIIQVTRIAVTSDGQMEFKIENVNLKSLNNNKNWSELKEVCADVYEMLYKNTKKNSLEFSRLCF